MFNLEIDAIYVNRKFEIATSAPTDDTISYQALQIPVLLRINLLPGGLVSVGAGGYYEVGMGSISDTNDTNGSVSSETYSSALIKTSDFGLLGSLRVQIPVFIRTHVLVDARYLYGLTEQSTAPSTATIKNRYVQVFAGLGFSI